MRDDRSGLRKPAWLTGKAIDAATCLAAEEGRPGVNGNGDGGCGVVRRTQSSRAGNSAMRFRCECRHSLRPVNENSLRPSFLVLARLTQGRWRCPMSGGCGRMAEGDCRQSSAATAASLVTFLRRIGDGRASATIGVRCTRDPDVAFKLSPRDRNSHRPPCD